MKPEKFKEVFDMLPDQPGIYKYFDKNGKIIYIGKAKNLKNRVSSYFNKQQHENAKTAVLVKQIQAIDFTVVDTEIDALLLENSLIKEFQPRYNIALKDDKTYPYICVTKERFPRVLSTRRLVRDGSSYYGPYPNVKVLYIVLDLIKQLFPLRTCTLNLSEKNIEAGKFKICLEFQIGNCLGPCEGFQTEESYKEDIKQIRYLLSGHLGEVKRNLKEQMIEAAANLKFEMAQDFKNRLELLETYKHKSTIISHTIGDIEVFAISSNEKTSFINYMRLSRGIIVATKNLEIRKKLQESDSEILEYAIAELHDEHFKEMVLPFEVDLELKGITITIPKGGDKKNVLDLSLKNAMFFKREKLNQYDKLNPEHRTDRIMALMQKELKLTEPPRHIECFDNSNLQGTNPVSACVVFRDGKPFKADYRIFNVKTVVGPDDFATMREALTRRYSRLLRENTPLPQLIIIDGGKGQLSSAVESLKGLGIYGKIAIIGIAKRLEEIYYPEDPLPLYIDKKSETLKIIQQLRDEAHRFGITNHRKRRLSSSLQTELTQITGIGKETAEMLLKSFKGVGKIKQSSLDEIAAVIGPAKAKLVIEYFHPV
jgi:excinuclease ABC subunit C